MPKCEGTVWLAKVACTYTNTQIMHIYAVYKKSFWLQKRLRMESIQDYLEQAFHMLLTFVRYLCVYVWKRVFVTPINVNSYYLSSSDFTAITLQQMWLLVQLWFKGFSVALDIWISYIFSLFILKRVYAFEWPVLEWLQTHWFSWA